MKVESLKEVPVIKMNVLFYILLDTLSLTKKKKSSSAIRKTYLSPLLIEPHYVHIPPLESIKGQTQTMTPGGDIMTLTGLLNSAF